MKQNVTVRWDRDLQGYRVRLNGQSLGVSVVRVAKTKLAPVELAYLVRDAIETGRQQVIDEQRYQDRGI